jgi:hypothetical protein
VITIVPVTAMPYAARERAGRAERDHEREAPDHQRGVHLGDVDLPASCSMYARWVTRGMYPSCTACCVSEYAPEMSAVTPRRRAFAIASSGRETTSARACRTGSPPPRDAEDERALAEVVEPTARQHEQEEREPDGTLAEVSEVRVQRLRTRDREHDGSEYEKGATLCVKKKSSPTTVQREQNLRRTDDLAPTRTAIVPNQSRTTGTEHGADSARAALLEQEQREQNANVTGTMSRSTRVPPP